MFPKPHETKDEHWDSSGHLKHAFAAILRAEAAGRSLDPNPGGFLGRRTEIPPYDAQSGERFVRTITSGQNGLQDRTDRSVFVPGDA